MIAEYLRVARASSLNWRQTTLGDRLRVIRRIRRALADRSATIAARLTDRRRSSPGETLTSEILPLLDACRFLERKAGALLRPRRSGRRGRPFWLTGTSATVHRDPHGVVLILGPANYPLMLPGIQTLQALTAGNAVIWKPAPGGERAAEIIAALLTECGLPRGLLTVTDASVETAEALIEGRPDRILLTGSYETGVAVLSRAAAQAIPTTLELSGCDAVFVLPGADLELAGRAMAFGLRLNAGATCIGPRRVFVPRSLAAELETRLAATIGELPACSIDESTRARLDTAVEQACAVGARRVVGGVAGTRVRPILLADADAGMDVARSDLFAPLISMIPVADIDEALQQAAHCPYSLGATVFGPARAAQAFAARVDAGVVVVNDMIVPTADPRLPFGGRRRSGFGVTRGAEGLLELTVPRTVIVRRGAFRPHYDPLKPRVEAWLPTVLRWAHGSWAGRLGSLRKGAAEKTNAEWEAAAEPARRGERT